MIRYAVWLEKLTGPRAGRVPMPAVPALTDAERCALWEFAEDIAEAGVSRVLVTPVDPSSLPADEA